MILIHKDNDMKKVTKGAFENFFEPLGYKIIKDATAKEVTKEIPKIETIDKEKKEEKVGSQKKNKKEE